MNAPSRPLLIGILAVSVFAMSLGAPVARLAAVAGAPALAIAFWRLGFTTALTSSLWAGTARESTVFTRRDWLIAVVGGVLLGVHFAAWIESIGRTSVAASTVLVSTSPLFAAVLAALFLNEKVSGRQVIGILVAVVGAAGIALDAGAGSAHLGGNLLAVAGAAAVAGYWVVGRSLRQRTSLWAYATRVYGVATLVLLGALLVRGVPLFSYSPQAFGWFVVLAIGPGLLGHTMLNWSLRWLPAPIAVVTSIGEPVGATIIAAVLPAIAERPGAWTMVGGVVTLAGIVIVITGQRPAGMTTVATNLPEG